MTDVIIRRGSGTPTRLTSEQLSHAAANACRMSKRFTKISIKDTGVKLCMEEGVKKNEVKETVLKCADAPHPDFTAAMQALHEAVRHICGFPEDYAKHSMKISGCSFSFNKDSGIRGAVITGLISLEAADAPFCFNTPHLPFKRYSEMGTSLIMPGFAIELLLDVENEASAYIKGKREQSSLFNGDGE